MTVDRSLIYRAAQRERARWSTCDTEKTGASTILKEIEEKRDFELFSSSGHFSQSFWC